MSNTNDLINNSSIDVNKPLTTTSIINSSTVNSIYNPYYGNLYYPNLYNFNIPSNLKKNISCSPGPTGPIPPYSDAEKYSLNRYLNFKKKLYDTFLKNNNNYKIYKDVNFLNIKNYLEKNKDKILFLNYTYYFDTSTLLKFFGICYSNENEVPNPPTNLSNNIAINEDFQCIFPFYLYFDEDEKNIIENIFKNTKQYKKEYEY